MALMKGGNTEPEQMQDTAYTPEQQREIKLGMIMLKARRVWRIFCLVMCGIGLLFSVFNTIAYGQSFIGGILSVIIGWALLYVFVLYVFLYLLAGRTIQFILFVRDLVGGNKDTRL